MAVQASVGAPALPLLVETHFQLPVPGPSVLDRATVWALLDAYRDRKVTLIAAPTGFGKTTALATWLRRGGQRYSWLSLDSAVDQERRFATYLASAIRRALPGAGTSALAALQHPNVDVATDVVGSLVNDIAGQDEHLILVLDDYHVIHAPACHAILGTLVAEQPSQLRLVISTRGDPNLPLGRLRATGQLGEIRAGELRFSDVEARDFLERRLGVDIGPAAISALVERTEGWPAVLNLAALSIAASPKPNDFVRAFAGSNRHVVDYLVSEVLDAQPPDTREFLLKTAVLNRLTGRLCDAVTGLPDGAARLSDLAQANLFVSRVDDQDQWFQYHRMFREAMRAELSLEASADIPGLLVAAARWHEADGSFDEAVRYALKAGDHELAARLIAKHYLVFVRGGHHAELRDLIALLDTRRAGPARGAVAFVAAIEAGLSGDATEVIGAHLADLEEFGLPEGILDEIPSAEAGSLFIRAAYLIDDVGRQRAAGAQLLALMPGLSLFDGIARTALGYSAYLLGHLQEAREVLMPYGSAVDETRPLMSIVAVGTRALVEIELGHLEAGARAARNAHEVTVRLGYRDSVATAIAHEALGVAMLAEGSVAEAIALIERAVHLTRETQPLRRAAALLSLAQAKAAAADAPGALACTGEARALIEASRDPGGLPVRLRTLERAMRHSRRSTDGPTPTAAEIRVLRLLPSSMSQREIAQELYISPDTVKTHVRRLYRKLEAGSRDEAVERARRAGLL